MEFAVDDRPVSVGWRFKRFEGDEMLTSREEERRMEKDEVKLRMYQGAVGPL